MRRIIVVLRKVNKEHRWVMMYVIRKILQGKSSESQQGLDYFNLVVDEVAEAYSLREKAANQPDLVQAYLKPQGVQQNLKLISRFLDYDALSFAATDQAASDVIETRQAGILILAFALKMKVPLRADMGRAY